MNKIIRDFKRPKKEIIEEFRKLPTPTICDSMERKNGMIGIRPVYPNIRICGPAFTVYTYVGDNLMIHRALEMAKQGDVLVVDGHKSYRAYWGEVMSIIAKTKGIEGLVIDGGVRDSRILEKIKFPVFSRYITPVGTWKNSPGSINVPIVCGDVTVNPGDLIIGDDDGVAVIPKENVKEVLKITKKKLEAEEVIKNRILKGESFYKITGLDKNLNRLNIKEEDFYD